jgi:glutamyl-tRNA(Gln) amidotransferase subunit D
MSDEFCYLHQGTKVRKLHTSRRDTFRSINVLPFAKVFYSDRKIEYLRKDFKVRDKKRKLKIDTRINPNVTLVYFHPGLKPEYVRSLAKFYDGIVIAGTGLGHVSTNPLKDRWAHSLLPALKELIGSGIPVVMAPQTLYGRLQMDVYEAGRLLNEIGVIGHGCDWLPEVALVKLMWVLGRTRKMERIKEEMLTNVAGEISSVSDPRAFLF